MAYTGLIVGSAVSLIGGLFGASKSASAARQQAELQNQAAARRLTYDNQMWEMKKEQLLSDRAHMVESVEIQARNEQKVAMFRDATNQQKYEYDLMIRNREQDSLEKQFDRSEQVFNNQISLNAQSEQIAIQNEYRSLEETHAEAAFNRTEQIIKNIQNEGKIRARGASGRSLDKAAQAEEYNHGAQMAMLNESLASAGRNTASILQEITLDKNSADLAALAQKMLDPGDLPLPLKPFKTPIADFQYPREFTEADFGPKPVLGATASPSAAASRVWGSAISGIAGSIGGFVAGKTP